MYIAIIGSRKRTDKHNVIKLVDSLNQKDCVISGGCWGVDRWAEIRAKQRGLKTLIIRPDFKNAKENYEITQRFYERNKKIAEHADLIYAFVAKDRRGGTENTIKWAKRIGKKIIIK